MEYFGRIMEWHTKLTDRKRAIYHLTLYRWPSVKKLALAEDTLAVAGCWIQRYFGRVV